MEREGVMILVLVGISVDDFQFIFHLIKIFIER